MKTVLWCLILVGAMVLLSGCASTRLGDFSMVSSRSVDLKDIPWANPKQGKTVTAEDSRYIFLIFPLGFPNVEEAIDKALEDGDGDVMLDAVIYSDAWWCGLFGKNTIRVQGKVVSSR